MAKKQEITLHKSSYRFVFSISADKQCVICQGYWKNEQAPILDWEFPKVPANNLSGNSAIYLDQAVMYAKAEREKTLTKDSEPEVGMVIRIEDGFKPGISSKLLVIWLSPDRVYYQENGDKDLHSVTLAAWQDWMKQAESIELH